MHPPTADAELDHFVEAFESAHQRSTTDETPVELDRFLTERLMWHHIIRCVEEALVDLRSRHKTVDLDNMGAFDRDRFQLGIDDREIPTFGDLVATALLLGRNRFASLLVNQLLAQPIARDLINLPERDALRC